MYALQNKKLKVLNMGIGNSNKGINSRAMNSCGYAIHVYM